MATYLGRQNQELLEENARLTERQCEVLRLLAAGKTMKKVAAS